MTEAQSMLEKIATAMWAQMVLPIAYEPNREHYENLARAALAAMPRLPLAKLRGASLNLIKGKSNDAARR